MPDAWSSSFSGRLGWENTLARGFQVGASAVHADVGVFLDAWAGRIRLHAGSLSERPLFTQVRVYSWTLGLREYA